MKFSSSSSFLLAGSLSTTVLGQEWGHSWPTFTPCPNAPSNMRGPPFVLTAQHQAVPTCIPNSVCHRGRCRTKYNYSTYQWVSTVIPCAVGTSGSDGSCTVTKTEEPVTFSQSATTVTSSGAVATGTGSSDDNFEVINKYWVCPYYGLGPLAMSGYSGSGLCEDCGSTSSAGGSSSGSGSGSGSGVSQQVDVIECFSGPQFPTPSCVSWAETWTSESAPAATATTADFFTTQVFASTNGMYSAEWTITCSEQTVSEAANTVPASTVSGTVFPEVTYDARTWTIPASPVTFYASTSCSAAPMTWDVTTYMETTITMEYPASTITGGSTVSVAAPSGLPSWSDNHSSYSEESTGSSESTSSSEGYSGSSPGSSGSSEGYSGSSGSSGSSEGYSGSSGSSGSSEGYSGSSGSSGSSEGYSGSSGSSGSSEGYSGSSSGSSGSGSDGYSGHEGAASTWTEVYQTYENGHDTTYTETYYSTEGEASYTQGYPATYTEIVQTWENGQETTYTETVYPTTYDHTYGGTTVTTYYTSEGSTYYTTVYPAQPTTVTQTYLSNGQTYTTTVYPAQPTTVTQTYISNGQTYTTTVYPAQPTTVTQTYISNGQTYTTTVYPTTTPVGPTTVTVTEGQPTTVSASTVTETYVSSGVTYTTTVFPTTNPGQSTVTVTVPSTTTAPTGTTVITVTTTFTAPGSTTVSTMTSSGTVITTTLTLPASTVTTTFTTTATTTATTTTTAVTTTTAPPSASTPFFIQIVNSGAKYHKRQGANYVGFSGGDGIAVGSVAQAALFEIIDGVLISGGQFVQTTTNGGFIIFTLGSTIPSEGSWSIAGSVVIVSSPNFTFGGGQALFCVSTDASIFIEETSSPSFSCTSITFIAVNPSTVNTSTSTTSSTTAQQSG